MGHHTGAALAAKLLHAVGLERRSERTHLKENAASRPQIASVVVGSTLPNLGWAVVGCAGLRLEHASIRNLGNIEIAEFEHTFRSEEEVGWFYVSVHDL